MEKKIKYILGFGIVMLLVTILLETVLLKICTDNLACVGINLILLYPALVFAKITNSELTTMTDILINAIFYFIVGGIIGLIIEKATKREIKERLNE